MEKLIRDSIEPHIQKEIEKAKAQLKSFAARHEVKEEDVKVTVFPPEIVLSILMSTKI